MSEGTFSDVAAKLSHSTLQTNQDTYVNGIDPDETDQYEPPYQDLHCLWFWFDCLLTFPFATMDMPEFNHGKVHFINSG